MTVRPDAKETQSVKFGINCAKTLDILFHTLHITNEHMSNRSYIRVIRLSDRLGRNRSVNEQEAKEAA